MQRANIFLDVFAQETFELEYYWGRVEFRSGCGAIHLHIIGIAKNKACNKSFYEAKTEKQKLMILEQYAKDMLGMVAGIK